jgi:hypothetical protein
MSGENTNNTYTNVSDLPTMSEITSPAYVPVEDANKDGKKVDLTTIMPGTLDTTTSTAQSTKSAESLSGSIKLHKVSKTGSYTDLLSRPKLNTTTTTSQPTNQNETISETIYLHAVSKTGSFNDIVNKPILDTRYGTERTPAQETINGTIYLHSVAKTGKIESLCSNAEWTDSPFQIKVDNGGRVSLEKLEQDSYIQQLGSLGNYDFYNGTADDLYDIPGYGVTVAMTWNKGANTRWAELDCSNEYYTCENHDAWSPVIWRDNDIETIRIIITEGHKYWQAPEGFIRISPVNPDDTYKMPTTVKLEIAFNKNFTEETPVYDESFENDNVPLTCLSGNSVIDTTKEGLIKVYGNYYEIIQP